MNHFYYFHELHLHDHNQLYKGDCNHPLGIAIFFPREIDAREDLDQEKGDTLFFIEIIIIIKHHHIIIVISQL